MDLTGEFRVPLPREAVFEALNDPDVLGRCIPGCQAIERVSEHEFDADVLARVGPVKARFRTRIAVSNLNPPESYTLSGEGRGGAAGFASGSADVRLEAADDGTVLTVRSARPAGGQDRPGGLTAHRGHGPQDRDGFLFPLRGNRHVGPVPPRRADRNEQEE